MEKFDISDTTSLPVGAGLAPAQSDSPITTKKLPTFLIIVIIALIAGATTGALLAKSNLGSKGLSVGTPSTTTAPTNKLDVKVGTAYGNPDEKTFRDKAEGVLQLGGIEGEGSHHLVKPGGISQTVYMTSSVLDLDLFIGHRVEVWGETSSGKKAGWLMDVGRLKVLELNASLPE